MLFYDDRLNDIKTELPTFSCIHCNRVVIKHPQRQRPRNLCRRCMALTCDSLGCVTDCNPIMKDAERAIRDVGRQPWLLRMHGGHPVDRIWNADGTSMLVLRKDNGLTERDMLKGRRE